MTGTGAVSTGGGAVSAGSDGPSALTGRVHSTVATPAQDGQQAAHASDTVRQALHIQAGEGGASCSRRRQISADRAEPPGSLSSISAISRHPRASGAIFNAAMMWRRATPHF